MFLVLRAIQEAPLSRNAVAEKCEMSGTKSSMYLNALMRKGFVAREPLGGKIYFRLTLDGVELGHLLKQLEEYGLL